MQECICISCEDFPKPMYIIEVFDLVHWMSQNKIQNESFQGYTQRNIFHSLQKAKTKPKQSQKPPTNSVNQTILCKFWTEWGCKISN